MRQKARLYGMSSKYTGSLSHYSRPPGTVIPFLFSKPPPLSPPPFPLPSCFPPLVNDVTRLSLAKKQQIREST